MRGDMHPAALRLLATSNVTTHTRPEPPQREYGRPRHAGWNVGGSYGQRPIRMRGRDFESLTQATKELRLSYGAIYKALASGVATYLDEGGK